MKTKIIIYIVILVLAITGLGVAIYFLNKDSPDVPTPTQETCVLTLKVNDESLGRIDTMSGIYYKNREVELKASAINNSTFMGWYLDEELLSTETSYNFLLKKDSNIEAMFKAKDMLTVDELAVKVINIDFTSEYTPVEFTLYRRFYKKSIKLSFSDSGILFPNVDGYLTKGIFEDSCSITIDFDIENNITGYKIFLSGYSPHNNYYVEIVDKEITENEAYKLISKLPFNQIKEFNYLVSKNENIFLGILNLLENEYENNKTNILNISSLFAFQVDNQISVYNQIESTVIINSQKILVNSFYDVDDTIPELDEDGNFVINASSYFNLEARYIVNSDTNMPSYWLTFPDIEDGFIVRRYDGNSVVYESPSNWFENMKSELKEFSFPNTSLVRTVEFKYDMSTTLTKLEEIYKESLQNNLEEFNQSVLGGIIVTADLSDVFNFYNDDEEIVNNVKFNVNLALFKS